MHRVTMYVPRDGRHSEQMTPSSVAALIPAVMDTGPPLTLLTSSGCLQSRPGPTWFPGGFYSFIAVELHRREIMWCFECPKDI